MSSRKDCSFKISHILYEHNISWYPVMISGHSKLIKSEIYLLQNIKIGEKEQIILMKLLLKL